MDKKNAVLGTIFLVAALGGMWWTSSQEADRKRRAAEEAASRPVPAVVENAEAEAECASAFMFAPPLVALLVNSVKYHGRFDLSV